MKSKEAGGLEGSCAFFTKNDNCADMPGQREKGFDVGVASCWKVTRKCTEKLMRSTILLEGFLYRFTTVLTPCPQ